MTIGAREPVITGIRTTADDGEAVRAARARVAAYVVSRDRELDLVPAAVACGRDILLEGPPGTSRSKRLNTARQQQREAAAARREPRPKPAPRACERVAPGEAAHEFRLTHATLQRLARDGHLDHLDSPGGYPRHIRASATAWREQHPPPRPGRRVWNHGPRPLSRPTSTDGPRPR